MHSFFILGNIKGYHMSESTETKLDASCGFVVWWFLHCCVPSV